MPLYVCSNKEIILDRDEVIKFMNDLSMKKKIHDDFFCHIVKTFKVKIAELKSTELIELPAKSKELQKVTS
jgi:hypothetical protein